MMLINYYVEHLYLYSSTTYVFVSVVKKYTFGICIFYMYILLQQLQLCQFYILNIKFLKP